MAKRKWVRVGFDLRPIDPHEPRRWSVDTREKAILHLIQLLSPEGREVVRNTRREDLIEFHLSS